MISRLFQPVQRIFADNLVAEDPRTEQSAWSWVPNFTASADLPLCIDRGDASVVLYRENAGHLTTTRGPKKWVQAHDRSESTQPGSEGSPEGGSPESLTRWGGAGDGDRTRIASLEGWSSAIELHPPARRLATSAWSAEESKRQSQSQGPPRPLRGIAQAGANPLRCPWSHPERLPSGW